MEELEIATRARTDFVDVTGRLADLARDRGGSAGAMVAFVSHTTAGITINEDADPAVVRDISTVLDRLIPWEAGYEHAEGNSAAHLKATLVGSSVLIPISAGRLVLGRWQGVFLCEFDGPRTRRIQVSFLAGSSD